MENRKRISWLILTRVLLVSLFLAATLILSSKEPESFGKQALSVFTYLIIGSYAFSIASLLALKLTRVPAGLHAYIQIIWDLVFVTVFLLLTGGTHSPFSFLY